MLEGIKKEVKLHKLCDNYRRCGSSSARANTRHDSMKNKQKSFQSTFQAVSHAFSFLLLFPAPALERAKCRALPGHYYDGLLRKCVMCVEVCGTHPAECWQHCQGESQLKYSVMLSASASTSKRSRRVLRIHEDRDERIPTATRKMSIAAEQVD